MPPAKHGKKKKQEQLSEEVKKIRKSNPKNLICADCPRRATPYVCLDFGTFLCAECAGVHRVFTHRVKSIAVATFTEAEVEKLREVGNEVSNAHYLGRYKKGRDTYILPREGERDKMEQFLKYKYKEKKWYKEKVKKHGKSKKDKKHSKRRSKIIEPEESLDETDSSVNNLVSPNSGSASSLKSEKKRASLTAKKKASITQPDVDLLSFATADAPVTMTTGPAQNGSMPSIKENTQGQQGGFDDWGNNDANWDPWNSQPSNGTSQPAPTTTTTQDNNEWGDELWSSAPATSTSTQPSQPAQPVSFDPFAMTSQPTQPVQAVQPQPTQPQNMGWGMGMQPVQPTQPIQQPMQQPMQQGMGGFWGQAQPQPQPQVNPLLGALNQVNKQKEEEERKKQEELQKKQAEEAKKQGQQTQQTQEKPKGDFFADLMAGFSQAEPTVESFSATQTSNVGQSRPQTGMGVLGSQTGFGQTQPQQGVSNPYFSNVSPQMAPQRAPQMPQTRPMQPMQTNPYGIQQNPYSTGRPMQQPVQSNPYMMQQAPQQQYGMGYNPQQQGGWGQPPQQQMSYGVGAGGTDNPFRT